MRNGTILKYNAWVALLAEGVDRNVMPCGWDRVALRVALLAEGVDRNWQGRSMRTAYKVALLAEGVDRNTHGREPMWQPSGRPPRGGRG